MASENGNGNNWLTKLLFVTLLGALLSLLGVLWAASSARIDETVLRVTAVEIEQAGIKATLEVIVSNQKEMMADHKAALQEFRAYVAKSR